MNYKTPTDDTYSMLNISKVNYIYTVYILSFVTDVFFLRYHQFLLMILNIGGLCTNEFNPSLAKSPLKIKRWFS